MIQPLEPSPIPVAILGLGRAGWKNHTRYLREDRRYHIVAVADPMEERRHEAVEALGCQAYATREALLHEGAAEVVVVATPNRCHQEDALAVLRSGRHCVLEKPMATSYADAVHLRETALETERCLAVYHQHLFGGEYRLMREIIRSGVLGEVFEIQLCWASYRRRVDWQTLLRNAGGHLNNHGPHALSILLPLLEAPLEAISGRARHVKDAGDADDHVHALLHAANGRTARLFLSTACAAPQPRFTLLGTCGSAVHTGERTALLRYYDPGKVALLTTRDGPAAGRIYGTGEVLPWQEEERALPPLSVCASFYDNLHAVLNGREPLTVAPESAVEVVRTIEWLMTGRDPAASLSIA